MTAETLRRAAALMRERAEAVVTWVANHPKESGGPDAWFTPMFIANAFAGHAPGNASDPTLREGWTLDGDHIASWHPDVALAVADWLDTIEKDVGTSSLAYHAALTVARTYLGDSDA